MDMNNKKEKSYYTRGVHETSQKAEAKKIKYTYIYIQVIHRVDKSPRIKYFTHFATCYKKKKNIKGKTKFY